MLKLADIDVYELVDALGMERTALVSARDDLRTPGEIISIGRLHPRCLPAFDGRPALGKGPVLLSGSKAYPPTAAALCAADSGQAETLRPGASHCGIYSALITSSLVDLGLLV
jgi:hypothetical protein